MEGDKMLLSYSSAQLHLVSAFMALEPADHLVNLARHCGEGFISEEVQGFVMEHCIHNSVGKCNAPNHSFIQHFLKKLIIAAESDGNEVQDDLYDIYASYIMPCKDDRGMADKKTVLKSITFLFPQANFLNQIHSRFVVPLQCSLNMLEGDTGCSIWPSSIFLSEFILSYPNIFAQKFCFEVGSGIGLVGVALNYVNADRIILSDGDQLSLQNLRDNLEMNRLHTQVECKRLVWEASAISELELYNPDVILGADVIYDPVWLPNLVRVLATLLKPKEKPYRAESAEMNHEKLDGTKFERAENAVFNRVTMAGEAPIAYMATIVRNPSTFDLFLKLAYESNLEVLDITDSQQPLNLLPYMKTYDRAGIRLYKISFVVRVE